jgi:hypothetical protein
VEEREEEHLRPNGFQKVGGLNTVKGDISEIYEEIM